MFSTEQTLSGDYKTSQDLLKLLKVCDGKAWASPFKQLHLGVKCNHTGFTVTQSYNFALANFLLISL